VKHSQAGIGTIEEELGYKVLVDFADGIERTVEWYRQTELTG
jgi:nucleoside-diphosphate-sugar epimerase